LRIEFLSLASVTLWIIVNLIGKIKDYDLNFYCSKIFGCTSSFFGYDALEHFTFGIVIIFLIVWICKSFPKYSILSDNVWKTIFALITFSVFISVLWEFGECVHDVFRLNILQEHLINLKLHVDFLDQPTNLDTMGDMLFNLLGSILSLFFIKLKIEKIESD
jgi:hypothetical protein